MSQFAFLQAEFAPVFDHAQKAEMAALSDPRAACFYARLALETAVKWMYLRDRALKSPYDTTLSALIHEPTFRKVVGSALVIKARIIKDHGNRAVHDTKPVARQTALTALRELFHFSYWFVRTYAKGAKPDAGLQFAPDGTAQDPAGRGNDTCTVAGSCEALRGKSESAERGRGRTPSDRGDAPWA